MANKQSLANKYRPQTFDDVSEQQSVRIILENQIKNDNIKHAYLFCGGAGTGKTTTARIIAKMINQGKGKPIELDCASKNGVDDMRIVQDECNTRPLNSKYKIFILDECHMLTVQAWNSMLKILEEPPQYVVFLFCTTNPEKIIGTIMSRVQRFNFSRISTQGIVSRLTYILQQEQINDYEQSAVEYIARLAKGGMRDAITTLEKCLDYDYHLTLDNVHKVTSGGVTEQVMLQLLATLIHKDCGSALSQFNDIYLTGIDISLFLKLYIDFLQNCVKYIITRNTSLITISDITTNWLNENGRFLTQIRDQLMSALNLKTFYSSEDVKILLESWIVQLCS